MAARGGRGNFVLPGPAQADAEIAALAKRGGQLIASCEPDYIRLWKVTGPTCSVRDSLSQARRSWSLSCGMLRLRADARFLAAQQAADIVAVHPGDQHRQHERQRRIPVLA